MPVFRFKDVLFYVLLKSTISFAVLVAGDQYNDEGTTQMGGFIALVGLISLVICYLILLGWNSLQFERPVFLWVLFMLFLMVNEGVEICFGMYLSLVRIIQRGTPWQQLFKFGDLIAAVLAMPSVFFLKRAFGREKVDSDPD